jgi:hypothetical protein
LKLFIQNFKQEKELSSKKLFYFFIVLVAFSSFSRIAFSQTISGKISGSNGETINFANIVIKDSVRSENIREFVIARGGQFSITLKNNYQQFVIEVSAPNYLKGISEITNPIKDKTYQIDFSLQKDSDALLEEVVISAKKERVEVAGDTTSYNVSAFRDGTERKIEDIIKKLPGIQVDEKTGEIKFKGRSIETIKLDGDDLFGSNYVIGSKNISVDMVEQVQAIEKYSENPLLKGIEDSEKVVLNLTLKKSKTDFSGNASVGLGLNSQNKAMCELSSDLLAVAQKYKSFATVSYNNIGTNNSPFDYFSYQPGVEQINEASFLAKKVIEESSFSSVLDDRRANLNNALFGSYNAAFKIKPKLSVKTSVYYIQDKITPKQFYENSNLINNERIVTSDNYTIEKKPIQYRGDVEMKFNSTKKTLIEYKCKALKETINTDINVLQNNLLNYQTILNTNNLNFKQSLLFTQKISEKKVWQLSAIHSSDDTPQNYRLSPSVNPPSLYVSNNQYSNFRKDIFTLNATLLGRTKKAKYSVGVGSNIEKNPFKSNFYNSDNEITSIVPSYTNDVSYRKNSFYTTGTYNILIKKWRFSAAYSLTYLEQRLDSVATQFKYRNDVIFEPTLSIKRKLSNISVLLASVSYRKKPFEESYIFKNPVYVSNRATVQNQVDLQFQNTVSYSLVYTLADSYEQFHLDFGINYVQNQGNYFSRFNIQEFNTQVEYFYLPKSNDNLSINFLIDKYIPSFESTIRLKSNYSLSKYTNILNNSDLRNNTTNIFLSELFMKTAFDGKINFENTFKYTFNESKNEINSAFINQLVNNTFRIIIKPTKQYLLLLSSDYYLPNTKNTQENFLFLDADFRIMPKNKKILWNFAIKNILDNNNFTQVQTTDYSVSTFQSNLLPRYFMCGASFHF